MILSMLHIIGWPLFSYSIAYFLFFKQQINNRTSIIISNLAVQSGNAASVLGMARPGENLDEIYYLLVDSSRNTQL